MKISRGHRGAVFVEFIIVLPIIAVIGLTAVDLTRAVGAAKIATSLSREVARIVYTECTRPGAPSSCVSTTRSNIQTFANMIVPGTQVIVGLHSWHWPTDTNSIDAANTPVIVTAGGYASKYPDSSTFTSTNITNVTGGCSLKMHRVIAVGEAYVPFRPVSPVIALFRGNDPLYAFTIL